MQLPGHVLRYFGEQWLDDLSLMAINQDGRDIWRLVPTGFDAHQNPIFSKWEKATHRSGLRGPRAGMPPMPSTAATSWTTVSAATGAMAGGIVRRTGFYVTARGGPRFSANMSGQDKISRYVPDGKGGYAPQVAHRPPGLERWGREAR